MKKIINRIGSCLHETKKVKKIVYLLLLVTAFGTACKKASDAGIDPVPTNQKADLPAGAKDGVVFINNGTSAIVTLYAPNKKMVSLIGEFNNWSVTASPMKNTTDGNYWWLQIDNLNPATEYAYHLCRWKLKSCRSLLRKSPRS